MASSLPVNAHSSPQINTTTTESRILLNTAHLRDFKCFCLKEGVCCLPEFVGAPQEALVRFEYLSKGAANVVFQIHRPDRSFTGACFLFVRVEDNRPYATTIPCEQIINRVLRVPRGKAKHLSSDDIIMGFESAVRPVFVPGNVDVFAIDGSDEAFAGRKRFQVQQDLSKHLMDLQRVALFSGVVAHLSTLTEPDTFETDEITSDHFSPRSNMAIHLPDMSPVPSISFTIELKPKWLLQSPTAPCDALRCRTCAMQVAVPKDRESYICPLRLVNGGKADVSSWARSIVAHQFGSIANVSNDPQAERKVSSIVDRLTDYLILGDGRVLLRHLQFLQSKLDPVGITRREQADPKAKALFDHNMRLAMTLRDCSLFIIIPYAEQSAITSKLADLDFKSEEKFDDWKEKEDMLLEGGMYTQQIVEGPECWYSQGEHAKNSQSY